MNIRKYIREQIYASILGENAGANKILIDKWALKKAVQNYINENPGNNLVYINDSNGMTQNSDQILNFITGNSSRSYLEKIANLIGKDIVEFEYEKPTYKSNFGGKTDSNIDPNPYGSLDENLKNKSIRTYSRLIENFASDAQPEDIKRRIEDVIDSKTGNISNENLYDIANEFDIDIESDEFMNMYTSVSEEVGKNFRREFDQDMEWVRDEFFDGEYPKYFEEFYDEFKNHHFDNYYSREEVKNKFEYLTTDPNQLSLFEGLKDKVPFKKIVFNMDLTSVNPAFRLALINKIKEYKGEGLKTDQEKKWYTFIPQEDVESFKEDTKSYNPIDTDESGMFSKFKTLTKQLKDGEKITFLNYEESETNPPVTVGYLKPGFIGPHKSLLKFPGGEMWITNSNIDTDYFYHRDLGDVANKFTKVYFSADFDTMDPEDKKELLDAIKKNKGISRLVSGAKKASGGQEYALIPSDKFDEFYQDAERFDPYEGEMEKDTIREEEELINEVRKIARKIFTQIVK